MSTLPSPSHASLAAAIGVALLGAAARADETRAPAATPGPGAPVAPTSPATPTPPPRRDGFTFGLSVGAGIGSIVGYPNDVTKIGFARWYTVTGARPASVLEAWAGGAITDWFSVTLGIKAGTLLATDPNKARFGGGMFHIEAFPLFPLGGRLRDLGVRFDAGLGAASVSDASGVKLVDGGSTSILGAGLFYEGIRAWKTAHGPFVMADYFWSDTARRPALFFGWRSVIYARP